ncbi:hypothetical protein HU230_0014735 [Bradyrhizobium quebecense]|uniref:Uncharacterized protein n=1 Tax=Bradyrhizobium quebecense TaxID=2748629 RepID=A0A973WSI7_9BRAD|nr:hypothetical protein [Bradyrhizobium quebecense]UGA47226.1 hypothetical protein HU230_0014735 [Bradyrhizobium quebecense]
MSTLRIVTFKDGDFWVAQCLEHDVCAQANDLDTLRSRIEVALEAESPLERLPAAPAHFFELWDRKSDFNKSGKSDGFEYEMALCA